MQAFNLDLCELPPGVDILREEVRAFLFETLSSYPKTSRARSWMGFDAEFSSKLGDRGWLGMTWPEPYGKSCSSLERYVVIEELLAFGAPVAAHWIGERQSGPLILRFGSDKQQQKLLPGIASGKSFFCIGMSEPNSGSDLASINTQAQRAKGGWIVNGQKIWTTYAQKCHYMIALVRTSGSIEGRHGGLSQLIIDLRDPDVTVFPIRNMIGDEEFNEVKFDNVFVSDSMLVGEEGNGWQQVIAELAFERSGPDRFLSSYGLMVELIRILYETKDKHAEVAIGRLTAHLFTLRQMSLAVAAVLDEGGQPNIEATVIKDLGVAFEQLIPEIAHDLINVSPNILHGSDYEKSLAYIQQACVSFSLRGGTTEILRSIIAKGLGLR